MLEGVQNWFMSVGGAAFVGLLFKNRDLRVFLIKIVRDFFRIISGKKTSTHSIFYNEGQLLYTINNIRLSTELKTDIFKTILTIKTQTVIAYLKAWSDGGKIRVNGKLKRFQNCTKAELKEGMEHLIKVTIYGDFGRIEQLRQGYENLIERTLIQDYGDEKGRKYYQYVYINHFKPYHEKNIQYIYNFLKSIFLYEKHTPNDLIGVYMTKVEMALSIAVDDLIAQFSKINGGLALI